MSNDLPNDFHPKRTKLGTEDHDKTIGEPCDESSGVGVGATPAFVDQYHVVKRIMEYLNVQNALQASQVNRQWADIGRIVRKQRKNYPFIFLGHPYSPHHKLAFEYFNGFEISEEAKQLVESGNDGFHAHVPKKRQKFPNFLQHLTSSLKETFMKSYDEPQLMIGFGTSSLMQYLTNKEPGRKESSGELLDKLSDSIQNSVPCIVSLSCGLVAALPDVCKSVELEKQKLPCLNFLAVPKVPGLIAKIFYMTKTQGLALRKNPTAQQCKELFGIDDENEPNLKAIVLLTESNPNDTFLITAVQEYLKTNPRVALAGGIPDKILVGGEYNDKVHAAGILFFGNELVRASSVALKESKMTARNRSKIDELKRSILPGDQSFGFMFACNGRGRGMHKRPNVEAELCNSQLPSTPLLGIFTFGELCHEVTAPSSVERSSEASPENIFYSYTTVFLLIVYKHVEGSPDDRKD